MIHLWPETDFQLLIVVITFCTVCLLAVMSLMLGRLRMISDTLNVIARIAFTASSQQERTPDIFK